MKSAIITTIVFTLFSVATSAQQPDTLTGQIVDMTGNGIRNVKITTIHNKERVSSNREGFFIFTSASLNDTLVVSIKKESFIIPINNRNRVRIKTLSDYSAAETEELPIEIGYGTIRQRDRNAPGNTISGDEIRRRGFTNIYDVLKAFAPALRISTTEPGGEATFGAMRGPNSASAPQTPLFLIDGVVVESIGNVNVYEIESIEIMKDASIYGAQGSNGAILINMIKHAPR